MSTISEPSANAIFFDIIDSNGQLFKAHLDLHLVVDFWAFQLCYKRPEETRWTVLSPSEDPQGNFITSYGDKLDVDTKFDTTEKCEVEIMRICAGFNRIIKKVFGSKAKTGLDGLVYLMKNRVVAKDNELSLGK